MEKVINKIFLTLVLMAALVFTGCLEDADRVARDVEALKARPVTDFLTGGDVSADAVAHDLSLPTSGANGTTITWTVVLTIGGGDASDIAKPDGTITRPPHASGDISITYTAAVTKGNSSETAIFVFTVTRGLSGDDFAISTTNTGTQQRCQVKTYGTKALVVWESFDNGSNYDIRGRFINIAAGIPIGSDFLVSTSNDGNQRDPQISISGSKAFVVWSSGNDGANNAIRGRFIDMETEALVDSGDFSVSTTDGISLLTPQAAIDGDNIIVVWHFRDNFAEGNYSVRGRLINLKTPLPGDDFQVSIDKSYGLEHLQVTASGGKAIAVWSLEDTNNFSGIQARVIDMKTGQLFGDNGFYVSTENDNFQYSPPRVVISGSKAIVAWLFEPYSTGSSSILGRLVDLSTGQPIGDKELVINTTEAAYLSSPCLSYYNNKILTLWKTVDTPANSDSIYGRFIDITTGQLTGTSDFIISAGEAPWRYNYLVSTSGERPLILWDSSNFQTGERALMGRYMDMPGEVLPGTEAFTVSTENAYQHASPQVGASDETAIAVWTYNGNIYGHALEISE